MLTRAWALKIPLRARANKQACCPGMGSPPHFALTCITTNSPRHSSGQASRRPYTQEPFRRVHGRARALPVCMCEECLRIRDGTKGLRIVSQSGQDRKCQSVNGDTCVRQKQAHGRAQTVAF